jgi:hypothetical protein
MERVWFQLKAPHRAVLAIALMGVMVASLAWLCVRDPKIAFLPGDGRAEWILFPSPRMPDCIGSPIWMRFFGVSSCWMASRERRD